MVTTSRLWEFRFRYFTLIRIFKKKVKASRISGNRDYNKIAETNILHSKKNQDNLEKIGNLGEFARNKYCRGKIAKNR